MSLEIAKLRNGNIALLTDELQYGSVKAVHYFSRHHQLKIDYENERRGRFVPGTLPDSAITDIESALEEVLIVEITASAMNGYYVPLERAHEE